MAADFERCALARADESTTWHIVRAPANPLCAANRTPIAGAAATVCKLHRHRATVSHTDAQLKQLAIVQREQMTQIIFT